MRSPYVIRSCHYIPLSSGFLAIWWGAYCRRLFFRSCKEIFRTSTVRVYKNIHPSKIVRCTCMSHKIYIKIHLQTTRRSMYDQLWLNLQMSYIWLWKVVTIFSWGRSLYCKKYTVKIHFKHTNNNVIYDDFYYGPPNCFTNKIFGKNLYRPVVLKFLTLKMQLIFN